MLVGGCWPAGLAVDGVPPPVAPAVEPEPASLAARVLVRLSISLLHVSAAAELMARPNSANGQDECLRLHRSLLSESEPMEGLGSVPPCGCFPATRRRGSLFRENGKQGRTSADKPVDVVGVKSETPSKFAIRPNRTCLQPRITCRVAPTPGRPLMLGQLSPSTDTQSSAICRKSWPTFRSPFSPPDVGMIPQDDG